MNITRILSGLSFRPQKHDGVTCEIPVRWASSLANLSLFFSIIFAFAETIKHKSYLYYAIPFVVFFVGRTIVSVFARKVPFIKKDVSAKNFGLVVMLLCVLAFILLYAW